jgi:DNA-binding MarR family transcriptional regulator
MCVPVTDHAGPGVDPVAAGAVDAFLTLLARMRGHYTRVCASFELTPQLGAVLRGLAVPSPMRELARRLHMDASNLTGLVDRLERRGLVERRPDPADRRVRHLVLTPEGTRLRHDLDVALTTDPPLLAGLDPTERGQLRTLLTRAVDAGGPDTGPPQC